MSLRFPYKQVRAKGPIWTLHGRQFWPLPLVPITLVAPSGSQLKLGLLDSGATDTVFPDSDAARVGIDLERFTNPSGIL
jgi:hypothetical protein